MSVRSAQAVTVLFSTRVFATGVGTVADSLPTGVLYLNGVSNAAVVTVTNVTAGLYTAAVTLPTLAVNDEVELVITATVSSVTDKAVIWGDTKDVFAGAIPDVAAGAVNGLLISGANSGTTTLGALTVTGATTLTGAVALQSTLTITGATTFAAISCTTLTASGAVAFQSTFAVTGTTTLAALAMTTLTASGAVALQSTLIITGATTFTGAVTAANASNSIVGCALTNAGIDALYTRQLTESYRAAGVSPTVAQCCFEIIAGLLDHSITGTTKTIRNIAGTAAKTYTLDSAGSPTSITETT